MEPCINGMISGHNNMQQEKGMHILMGQKASQEANNIGGSRFSQEKAKTFRFSVFKTILPDLK